ncbi:MAG: hypothetical protein EZS28_039190 [Streblomastix strix]|uniref:Uncharacterized protein n=1 Tax=Streblomastix strix TaxID=222440 RepID=A0A5J4U4X6_9EUKA|nr:MAG: hypothetical protein EZS28_039190 [Streblomastix strix]
MIENDTNIEYFDGGYFIRDKKQIKRSENGKRGLKVVTQAQQKELLMQAKGKTDQQFGYKKQPAKMFESDSDSESENSVATEEEQPKPAKQVKRKCTAIAAGILIIINVSRFMIKLARPNLIGQIFMLKLVRCNRSGYIDKKLTTKTV